MENSTKNPDALRGAHQTAAVCGIALLALLGWETYTLVNKADKDTISEVLHDLILTQPLIAVALGALVTHWVASGDNAPAPLRWIAHAVRENPEIALGMGVVVGATCWPLKGYALND